MRSIIRRATLEDTSALSLIGAATFLEAFIDLIPGPDLIKHCKIQHSESAYAGYVSKPRSACWLAEHEETRAPVGYATVCPPDLPLPTEPDDLELKRIYLFSKAQGSGAASGLLAAVEAYARDQGAARLFLGTYEDNQRAIGFYKREGFETVGRRSFQVGDQLFDDIVMMKPLQPVSG